MLWIVSTPDVHDYLDYRRFLADWFEARKKANPRFSYRVFARLAGQSSSSLLHHVIKGKRNLTPATVDAFAGAMKLRAREAELFALLVQLDQARTDEERNQVWEQLSATRRFRAARRVDGAGFRYLSHWYYPAIRELALRPDFVDDPTWIASALRPRITEARARQALDALFELGLLVRQDDGTVAQAEASVVTPHEVSGLAVHNYHRGMLQRASDAIDSFDPEVRHLGGVTVGVPAALVPRLKEELAAFLERVLNLCDESTDPVDRVYQLNMQLFPLSEGSSGEGT